MTPDPVDQLLALVDRIQRRTPRRLLPGELWQFTAILVAVNERRRDWIAALPPEDQQLFHTCVTAALEGFQGGSVH